MGCGFEMTGCWMTADLIEIGIGIEIGKDDPDSDSDFEVKSGGS
jgi:hypothetical protein